MKYKQNEKIFQIKNETLVVGIDIEKGKHYAQAFDCRGMELGRLLRFSNSSQGFQTFDEWIKEPPGA